MPFIQFIKAPFIASYDGGSYSDSLIYTTVNPFGYYNIIPFGSDAFETYPTGFRTLVSGAGFWLGSGQTVSQNFYFYETFESYPTGAISGLIQTTGVGFSGYTVTYPALSSGITISGYTSTFGLSGYIVASGYH